MYRFKAGEKETFICPICGTKCNVVRNKERPPIRSWTSSMLWRNVPEIYDDFVCPNLKEKWHETVNGLQMEIRRTQSKRLKKIIQKDIDDILSSM